jgi:hypothetical protein
VVESSLGVPTDCAEKLQWQTAGCSVRCKTVITVVLTVMSGMDPHMISGNIGMGNDYVLVGLC